LTAIALSFELAALGGKARPRRYPFLASHCSLANKIGKTLTGQPMVAFLTAKILNFQHQNAFVSEPAVADLQQTLFDGFRQRRLANIKTQLNSRRHLVDVLAASTLGANCRNAELRLRQCKVLINN